VTAPAVPPSPSSAPDDSASDTRPAVAWGLAPPLLALVAGIVGATVGVAIAAALTGAELGETTLATSIGSLAGMWVVYLAIIVATVRSRGSGDVGEAVGLRVRPIDLLIGVGAGLATSIVVVRLVYLMLELTSVVDESDLDKLGDPAQKLDDMASGPGFLLLALFVGIGAPIVEEVFFRGFLQPAAVKRLGAPAGLILTALIFGAVHFQLLQFPALAVFGLILGLLAHHYRRLGPAIVAHMVFNGLTLAALAAS
jgi:uncharacterized protein